jgi:predicted outer membrane repeat protein
MFIVKHFPLGLKSKGIRLALFAVLFFSAQISRAASFVRVPADRSNLQDAIAAVDDGGVIEMAAGTYTAPSGGFTVLDYGKGFTIRAASGAAVVLSGSNATDILRIANSLGAVAHTFIFDRLTFSGGVSTTNFIGGAMTLVRNNAIFKSCVFQNNAANSPMTGGGALWFESASVSFQQCTWTGNQSRNYGGAISATTSHLFLRECTLSGNRVDLPKHATNAPGGAIFAANSSIYADACRFENNHAGDVGGAIYCAASWQDPVSTPVGLLVVNNSIFTGNSAFNDPLVVPAGPPIGGAVHIEDQTTAKFYNSRFYDNFAVHGGAISNYRGIVEIEGCVFQRNHADGTKIGESIGGSLFSVSADVPDSSTNFGTVNRRSASLTVRDSLFQGDGITKNALQGGAIFVSGDLNAAYGLIGITQNGSGASNRATLSLTRVVFSDLVTIGPSGSGSAGAVGGAFVALTMDNSIIENCSTSDFGGGLSITQGSVVTIKNSTIAGCRSGGLGGGILMFGGILDLHNTNLVDNQSAVRGSALVTSPTQPANGVPAFDMEGLVANCVISKNSGGATIYDADGPVSPFNRLQYSANQIFPGDLTTFFNDNVGFKTVIDLNSTTIPISGVAKTVSANTPPTSAAIIGAILMVPPTALTGGASGETLPLLPFLGYASSGGNAAVDGTAQRTNFGVISNAGEGTHTLTVNGTAFVTPPSPPAFAANIATRLPVGNGQNVLIGGFIIHGPAPKRLIIRAIGPSLNGFVGGALQDPKLELHDATGALIASNDNWRSTQVGGFIPSDQSIDINGSGLAPTNEAESSILATLNPGAYTAIVQSANSLPGIALVEIYDLDPVPTSKLANISTRGFVKTDPDVMIGGFIYLGGPGATKVVVRGIGPSLSRPPYNITNPLQDPVLELHDANGGTIINDDWAQSPRAAELPINFRPSDSRECAIFSTGLPLGNYTAILRGKNETGVGVVEVYIFE